jgi:hypothetical protein
VGRHRPGLLRLLGLIVYSWRQAGFRLTIRTAAQMYANSTPIASGSEQPGDLLFSEFDSDGPGHVQIVVRKGLVVTAPRTGTSSSSASTPGLAAGVRRLKRSVFEEIRPAREPAPEPAPEEARCERHPGRTRDGRRPLALPRRAPDPPPRPVTQVRPCAASGSCSPPGRVRVRRPGGDRGLHRRHRQRLIDVCTEEAYYEWALTGRPAPTRTYPRTWCGWSERARGGSDSVSGMTRPFPEDRP